MQNNGQGGGTPGVDIGAVKAWDITTGSRDIVIAEIDSGIDYNHPDLAANMWRNVADCYNDGIDHDGDGYINDCYGINPAYNTSDPYDDTIDSHGTHVAGVIGAVGNNSEGVVGVAWQVSLMACKAFDRLEQGSDANIIACLEYVHTMKQRGVNIVATNNSYGGAGDNWQANVVPAYTYKVDTFNWRTITGLRPVRQAIMARMAPWVFSSSGPAQRNTASTSPA